MAMTDEERFIFDLNGYLVRDAILAQDEIDAIVDQIRRAKHDPESLSAVERRAPGGASSLLVDHPSVVEVLTELLPGNRQHDQGNYLRCDTAFFVWRERGEGFFGGELHRGADSPADPFFGYRVHNGQIHAGQVNVVFELTDVSEGDGATGFIVGSHKSNFPLPDSHSSTEPGKRSPFYQSYSCPAGSAIFFNENLLHAGPVWQRESPRVAAIYTYVYAGLRWHPPQHVPTEVVESLTPERQAYFREPWVADTSQDPPRMNTVEAFLCSRAI